MNYKMLLKERILYTFNKFYSNLIKDLKELNPDLRHVIKKNYKVIDKMSSEYCDFFIREFPVNDDPNSHILKDITVQQVIDVLKGDHETNIFWNYFYILSVISLLYKIPDEDEKQLETLFKDVLNILNLIQKNENANEAINEILDDDIRSLLLKINIVKEVPKDTKDEAFSNMFGEMSNSKICNLAKEISKDIDVSNIKVDNPEDLFKMMDFSGSNNVLGDIIKKVSTKIHDQISTGELKQEDLFGEAMSMMGMMGKGGAGGSMANMANMMGNMMGKGGGGGGMADMASMMGNMMNNPMMSEMMKMAKKGKTQMKTDAVKKTDVRERLRLKLEDRRKKNPE